MGWCWQLPPEQKSVVQALPSLQLIWLCWQPNAGWQESVVQELPSLQLMAVPVHDPPEHWSLEVHELPSPQGPEVWMVVQPPLPLHCWAQHCPDELQV